MKVLPHELKFVWPVVFLLILSYLLLKFSGYLILTKFNPLDPITGFLLPSLVEVIRCFEKSQRRKKITNKETDRQQVS